MQLVTLRLRQLDVLLGQRLLLQDSAGLNLKPCAVTSLWDFCQARTVP